MSEDRQVSPIDTLVPVVNLIASETAIAAMADSVRILQDQVKEVLPRYDVANYTDENIKDAKADRTTLNKFKTVLNDKKIAIKKEFMKPYDELEEVVKKTIAMIDEAAGAIDKVIKGVEAKERLARQEMISGLWNATKFTLVPLCQVQKPEWMVKATSKKAIGEAMAEIQSNILSNIALLEQMVDESDKPLVRLNFLDDLDFKRAMTFAQKVKLQRDEAKNKPIESAPPVTPPPPLPPASPASNPLAPNPSTGGIYVSSQGDVKMVAAAMQPVSAADPVISRTFKVIAPTSVMIKLGDFMAGENIPFEVVARSP